MLGFPLVPRYLYEPLVAFIFAALLAQVVLCSGNLPSPLARLLDRQPFVGIGVISYSVFPWSFPATVFLMQHGFLLRGSAPWQLAANLPVPAKAGILATEGAPLRRS